MYKKESKRKGQSLVEIAFILPILLLIILGLVEFGRALFIYAVVSNAAREGVRHGIVSPNDVAGINGAIAGKLILVPTDAVDVDVSYDNLDNHGNTVPGQSRVIVKVDYTFRMITPVLSRIFPPAKLSFSSARTIVQGARVRQTISPAAMPPRYPTATADGAPPAPGSLVVTFVGGYPVRGPENGEKGAIRVKVYVAADGVPITGANVTVNLESGDLVDMGGGYYGGDSAGCWVSKKTKYVDQTVTVTANKSGYAEGTASLSTESNPHVDYCP